MQHPPGKDTINAMGHFQMHSGLLHSPLGSADHNTVPLIPAYIPIIRRVKKVIQNIKQWINDNILVLQGCLESTDWTKLLTLYDNLNEQVDTISSYASFCVDSIIPPKTVIIFPNDKPWVTKKLK